MFLRELEQFLLKAGVSDQIELAFVRVSFICSLSSVGPTVPGYFGEDTRDSQRHSVCAHLHCTLTQSARVVYTHHSLIHMTMRRCRVYVSLNMSGWSSSSTRGTASTRFNHLHV